MQPLIGVTVVSLAVNLPGPLAAARLAELGAAVTKVEPATGSARRRRARLVRAADRAPKRADARSQGHR